MTDHLLFIFKLSTLPAPLKIANRDGFFFNFEKQVCGKIFLKYTQHDTIEMEIQFRNLEINCNKIIRLES